VVAGLLALGLAGCDYLNPLSGGSDPSGTSTNESANQSDQTDDESGAEESSGSKDGDSPSTQTAGPDAGQPDSGGIGELTVPEPSGDDSDEPARNPFEPKIQTDDESGDQDQVSQGPLEPLERYALGQLELAAIISGVAVPKAMFISPDNMGHLVQEGDRVGQEGGEIIDIRSNAVELSIPQGPDEPAMTRTVELNERGVGAEAQPGGDLTRDEQEMLDRLMESEQGREALRERYRGSEQQGQSPPSERSGGGLQPPGGGQTQGNR
jgi:hypothetical protein